MFLEIRKNIRTGFEEGRSEMTGEEVLAKHPLNHDLRAWIWGARKGSKFSILLKGVEYIKK